VFRPVLVIPFCSMRRALRIPLPVVQCGEHAWEGDAADYFGRAVMARIANAYAARGVGPLVWSTATIELTLAREPSASA
jgi:hypothetical protein